MAVGLDPAVKGRGAFKPGRRCVRRRFVKGKTDERWRLPFDTRSNPVPMAA
jgi:hypothetical protein